MSKFHYTETERQINKVLKYQDDELRSIKGLDMSGVEACISESERLLENLGYGSQLAVLQEEDSRPLPSEVITVPSWKNLCMEAEKHVSAGADLESIFTEDELRSNDSAIRMLRQEYRALHKLDKFDITICAVAGIVGAAVDILLVGIPQKTPGGMSAGRLSDYIRNKFDEKFPPEEMEKLANSKVSKVPYDAQDNRNTKEYVDGLSTYYHRLLSLGHDPLLGLIFGVFDILTGRMTTIDKKGKIVSQVMESYADRKECDIFSAVAKQILHFKSDITTSMGLPVPLMSLFNFLQFGSIGEENQTIAEIVQGMYYEGYDFVHFCGMAVPVMLTEVIVRLGYALKRIKEGNTVKDSIPFSADREKHPKLVTMLFLGHSAAAAVNAGKVWFTQNPLAINYPQWLAFAKYSYMQLKWAIIEKPEEKRKYVTGRINEELQNIYQEIDNSFDETAGKYIIIFES